MSSSTDSDSDSVSVSVKGDSQSQTSTQQAQAGSQSKYNRTWKLKNAEMRILGREDFKKNMFSIKGGRTYG